MSHPSRAPVNAGGYTPRSPLVSGLSTAYGVTMVTRVPHALAAAALLLLSVSCGKTEKSAAEAPVGLVSIAPDNVKNNFDGDVILTGHGFDLGAQVLVNDVPANTIPGMTVTVLDYNTIKLHISYLGAGQELASGDRDVRVRVGLDSSEERNFHVRPLLFQVDHVRTLPGQLTTSGGRLDVWVRPFDSDGVLLRPGHELVGNAGLLQNNFRIENVRVYANSTSGNISASGAAVALSEFDPVNDAKPLAVSISIDQSGSMIGGAFPGDPNDERITQSQGFVDRLSSADEVQVLKFQQNAVTEVIPFTTDKIAVKNALDSLRTGEAGSTPLYDSTMRSITDVAAKGVVYSRAVIVLTDGIDTVSTTTVPQVIDNARTNGIPVFPIGLGNPNDPNSLNRDELQEIANQTGGLFLFAEDPTALASVFAFLSEILASSYRVETNMTFNPPITAAGNYTIEADLVTTVDGEEIRIAMPPFRTSFIN